MSEPVTFTADDGDGTAYDNAVQSSFPQEGTKGMDTCQFITKANGTSSGLPVIAIKFNSVVWSDDNKDKRTYPVITAMTAKQFLAVACGLVVAHPVLRPEFESMFGYDLPEIPEGQEYTGKVDGSPYIAQQVAGYLVSVDGVQGTALAMDAESIPHVAKQMKEQNA